MPRATHATRSPVFDDPARRPRATISAREEAVSRAPARERERGRRKEEEEEERKDKGGERERKSRRNRAWRKRDNARVATSSNYLFVPFLVHFLLLLYFPLSLPRGSTRVARSEKLSCTRARVVNIGPKSVVRERASERAGGRTVERRAIVSWVYLNSVSAG